MSKSKKDAAVSLHGLTLDEALGGMLETPHPSDHQESNRYMELSEFIDRTLMQVMDGVARFQDRTHLIQTGARKNVQDVKIDVAITIQTPQGIVVSEDSDKPAVGNVTFNVPIDLNKLQV